MFSNLIDDGRALVLRCFPERQIYLRSGGEVTYHTLKTRTQLGLFLGGALVLFWCLLTLFNLFWGNNPLRTPAQQNKLVQAEFQRLLEDAEARYEDAQLQLTQQQESFERAARNFQEKHAALAQLVNQPISDELLPSELEDVGFGEGQVLMSPTTRDEVPRTARVASFHFDSLNTGTDLDQPMENLERTQNAMLVSAELSTHEKIERDRAIIEATNLSIDTILNAGLGGKGGPLIEVDDVTQSSNTLPAEPRIVNIRARAEEAKRLEEAIKAIPLGIPVAADYYRTSSFGVRKDPFTNRPARHNGADFASFKLAPIVATADGTVRFSGIRSGYGRVVEVDHGYGFITRYAHMAKAYVKRGQKVKQGDKLGGMGSTGRSTGTHLHYEIHFQGQAQDPDNFLKAGRYVQQN